MTLAEELAAKVNEIIHSRWSTRVGQVVPESEAVRLGNEAVILQGATVLYADMSESTRLVDLYKWSFAAEVYKSFLYCSARVIRAEGGSITAYDGDRIMAVFIGDSKNTKAVRAAFRINYCAKAIIDPILNEHYSGTAYAVRHVVGVDTSELHVARTGVRGNNDLVWVGRAANYAAKLSSLSDDYSTRVTEGVYKRLNNTVTHLDGRSVWEEANWIKMDNMPIYRSNAWWEFP